MNPTLDFKNIKLVIWDLDETFWKGTLSEGGITKIQANLDCVRFLAKRGIISSICSKNDPQDVRRKLQELGIFEYFVFPSVSWEAKGPRVRDLLESIGLRAVNTLMIDDSPSNLDEIAYFNPGIHTCLAKDWKNVDYRLWGKEDEHLTRLTQYHLMEQKQLEKNSFAGSNHEFLKTSNIRASIIPLTSNDRDLSRVYELIERSNQLNFTKQRYHAGFSAFVFYLKYNSQCSYKVFVKDRFGDYGLSGFVSINKTGGLEHFAFSCRLLGMGIEGALYDYVTKNHNLHTPAFVNSLSKNATWVSLQTLNQDLSSLLKVDGPSVLMTASCFGEALSPFLSRDMNLDNTYNMYSFDIKESNLDSISFPLIATMDDKTKLGDLLEGYYDILVVEMYSNILFPEILDIFDRIKVKIFARDFLGKPTDAFKKIMKTYCFGGNLYGREIASSNRLVGSLKYALFKYMIDPLARSLVRKYYSKVDYKYELLSLVERIPESTKIIFISGSHRAFQFPENPEAEAIIRTKLKEVNDALAYLSLKDPRVELLDITPILTQSNQLLEDGLHFTHEGFVNIAKSLLLKISFLHPKKSKPKDRLAA